MDDVVADLKAMKIKQWMEKMQDREKWRWIVEEAKAHPQGCSADRKELKVRKVFGYDLDRGCCFGT